MKLRNLALLIKILAISLSPAVNASINSSSNVSLEIRNLSTGTQNVAAGKSLAKDGTGFYLTLPNPTTADIAKRVTSPTFVCNSGLQKNGLMCIGKEKINATTTCREPPTPSWFQGGRCTKSWYPEKCNLRVVCGGGSGNSGGNGGGMYENISGTKVYVCPSTYDQKDHLCIKDRIESTSPRCSSGWKLGYGGYVCFKS